MDCCKYENLQTNQFVYNMADNSSDVEQFIIMDSNISSIPSELFINIKNLQHLTVMNSGVRNISVRDFFGADKLLHLNLTKNAIQTLEPKLFVHAGSLLVLDLSFNDLTTLSEYAFDHLDMLQVLILSHNHVKTFEVNQPFDSLETFSIEDNALTQINQATFRNSVKIREINLKNNNLRLDQLI